MSLHIVQWKVKPALSPSLLNYDIAAGSLTFEHLFASYLVEVTGTLSLQEVLVPRCSHVESVHHIHVMVPGKCS
jgi:hypothetical protein